MYDDYNANTGADLIIASNYKDQSLDLKFNKVLDLEERTGASGNKYPVLVFETKQGEKKAMTLWLRDATPLLKDWGKPALSENWKGFYFDLLIENGKLKVSPCLTVPEETVN